MAGEKTVETTGLLGWLDRRFPVTSTGKAHLSEYYAPKNFNFWYFFGSLALLVLVLQIVTGIFLVMHYKPDAERAFQSVEYIMREVPWGWLVRYMHSTGASAFFIIVYLHMTRAHHSPALKPLANQPPVAEAPRKAAPKPAAPAADAEKQPKIPMASPIRTGMEVFRF